MGYPSFATAAFFGLGAYVGGIAQNADDADRVLAWIAAAAGGAIFAALLGSILLGLRGHYFAIGTIAVVEVMREVANNWEGLTGGAVGLNVPILAGSPREVGIFFYFVMWGSLARPSHPDHPDRRVEVRLQPALHPAERERGQHGRDQRVPDQVCRLHPLRNHRFDGGCRLCVDGRLHRAQGRVQRPALDRGAGDGHAGRGRHDRSARSPEPPSTCCSRRWSG